MRQDDTFPKRRALLLGGAAVLGATVLPVRAIERGPDGRYPLEMRKRTAEDVKYQSEPYKDRTCAQCVLYQGDGVCVILDFAVSPNGWCNQWVPNTMG
ncbi:MAG: high-potential iron-sulfur protein [Burkholderiales bacterium]